MLRAYSRLFASTTKDFSTSWLRVASSGGDVSLQLNGPFNSYSVHCVVQVKNIRLVIWCFHLLVRVWTSLLGVYRGSRADGWEQFLL